MAILSARATQEIAFICTAYKCLGKAWEMVMKMEISQFPVISPFLLAKQSSSPTFSKTYAPSLSWDILGARWRGAFLLGSGQPCIPRCLGRSTSSCIVQSCSPSIIIWLLGLALCVGVCFSCFLTIILVWWGGNIFVQMVPIPGHFAAYLSARNHREFFFLLPQEGPSVCSMLPILLVNLKTCSLCKTTL